MTVFRVRTASGMFYDRQSKCMEMLTLPDFGGGDLTEDQRREALDTSVGLRRPLASLALFHSVVALEDLIRDTGDRLAAVPGIRRNLPKIGMIASKLKPKRPQDFSVPPDTPAASYLKPAKVNGLYRQAVGVDVIRARHAERISDLALLRHTIAHHGGLVRQRDIYRFRYYDVGANHLINPPREFVIDTVRFLSEVGTDYLDRLRAAVFRAVVPTLVPVDQDRPPQQLLNLIECFNYFGKLLEAEPQPRTQEWYVQGSSYEENLASQQRLMEGRAELYRQCLLEECLDETLAGYTRRES